MFDILELFFIRNLVNPWKKSANLFFTQNKISRNKSERIYYFYQKLNLNPIPAGVLENPPAGIGLNRSVEWFCRKWAKKVQKVCNFSVELTIEPKFCLHWLLKFQQNREYWQLCNTARRWGIREFFSRMKLRIFNRG